MHIEAKVRNYERKASDRSVTCHKQCHHYETIHIQAHTVCDSWEHIQVFFVYAILGLVMNPNSLTPVKRMSIVQSVQRQAPSNWFSCFSRNTSLQWWNWSCLVKKRYNKSSTILICWRLGKQVDKLHAIVWDAIAASSIWPQSSHKMKNIFLASCGSREWVKTNVKFKREGDLTVAREMIRLLEVLSPFMNSFTLSSSTLPFTSTYTTFKAWNASCLWHVPEKSERYWHVFPEMYTASPFGLITAITRLVREYLEASFPRMKPSHSCWINYILEYGIRLLSKASSSFTWAELMCASLSYIHM